MFDSLSDRLESILKKLCSGLADDGILIFTSGGLDEPDESKNPFLGQPLYHAAPGIPKLLEVITQSESICRHLEYDQHPEKHIFLIVQKSEKAVQATSADAVAPEL